MAQVEPAKFGADGRSVQGGRDDESKGRLRNITFSSRCPPDIQPNTRIIALCGITDYTGDLTTPPTSDTDTTLPAKKSGTLLSKGKQLFKSPSKRKEQKGKGKAENSTAQKAGSASPVQDGWFLSDFYLFHHLFRGLGEHITRKYSLHMLTLSTGAIQLWITSESPSTLVDRYGEYRHGDPEGERRVVLNRALLPDIENAGNMRVFTRTDLLEDFMRTFKAECNMAAALNHPVLLMIFGHRDPKTYGVSIGGAGDPLDAPRLRTKHIVACLRGVTVPLTMLMTSCFSGGWVLQPDLNISALTAGISTEESYSWLSTLGGRHCGSVYATAVRRAFMKLEDERATQIHPCPSDEDIEDRLSAIYAELTNTIHSILLYDLDRHGEDPRIQFTAQDDDWEMEWRKRSGIPLARFEKQWTKLPVVSAPKSDRSPKSGRTGGLGLGPRSQSEGEDNVAAGPYGMHQKLNADQSKQAIKSMAHGYLNSFPGADNMSSNILLHGDARRILQGTELNAWHLGRLQAGLRYRVASMKLATEYKDIAGLDFIDCEAFDRQSWQETLASEIEDRRAPSYKYDKFINLFDDADLFDPPVGQEGYTYCKPWDYLGVASLESGLDLAGVRNALAKMQEGMGILFSSATPILTRR